MFIFRTWTLIPDAINDLVSQGATKITIFPYFLAVGLYVAEDIPEEIDKAKIFIQMLNLHIASFGSNWWNAKFNFKSNS